MGDKVKVVCTNKRASFDYYLLSLYEGGISLKRWEVKSIRCGHCSIAEAFVRIENGQVVIKNMYIKAYDKMVEANTANERADRVLLLHRNEIEKIYKKVVEAGNAIVPTRVYFKGHLVKVEIALAKGKHTFDKKQCLKEKDIARDTARQLSM